MRDPEGLSLRSKGCRWVGSRGGGTAYLPAGHSQLQAMGQAVHPVVVHKLSQAGEGHGFAEVKPASTPPDLVVPHGLPVPHWREGHRQRRDGEQA